MRLPCAISYLKLKKIIENTRMFFPKENTREINNDSRRDYQKLRTILDAIGGLLQNEGPHEGRGSLASSNKFFFQKAEILNR